MLAPLTLACVTGLALNHTVDLDLGGKTVTWPWVLSCYGMALEGKPVAFGIGGKAYAASWGGKLFHRSQAIAADSPLVGAVPLRDGTAVVTATSVHYFGLDGELIESMDGTVLPATPVVRAGRTADFELVIETSSGSFTGDANLLGFRPSTGEQETEWSLTVPPTEADLEEWREAFHGGGIPLDRVILDLHSGRIFGTFGKWLYDLAVIGAIILSATGFLLFLRARRRPA